MAVAGFKGLHTENIKVLCSKIASSRVQLTFFLSKGCKTEELRIGLNNELA